MSRAHAKIERAEMLRFHSNGRQNLLVIRSSLSLISILTHVDLVTRRVFFMVSEVQIIIFQLFMEDTVVGVKSTTYSGLITSGFLRTNNNNNKRIF